MNLAQPAPGHNLGASRLPGFVAPISAAHRRPPIPNKPTQGRAARPMRAWAERKTTVRLVEEHSGPCHLLGRHTVDALAEYPLLPERIT